MKILHIRTDHGKPGTKRWQYNQPGGVGYYRHVAPARYVNGTAAIQGRIKPEENKLGIQFWVNTIEKYDLVHTSYIDNPQAIVDILSVCSHLNKPLLVDFDDNLFAVDDRSPHKFSYIVGSEKRHFVETLLRECTAITVTTPPLVKVYEKFGKPVHMLPNYNDAADWQYTKEAHKTDIVVIGWTGSTSHSVEYPMMFPVFKAIQEKYGDRVVFAFMGHFPENYPDKSNFFIDPGVDGFFGHPELDITYPHLLAKQKYDIGIAPLETTEFNDSRSAIKWMEYAMYNIPCVASDYGPYKRQIRDGEDGLLVATTEGWVNALSHLIDNVEERKRIGKAAKKRVLTDFQYEKHANEWNHVYRRYIKLGFKGQKTYEKAVI